MGLILLGLCFQLSILCLSFLGLCFPTFSRDVGFWVFVFQLLGGGLSFLGLPFLRVLGYFVIIFQLFVRVLGFWVSIFQLLVGCLSFLVLHLLTFFKGLIFLGFPFPTFSMGIGFWVLFFQLSVCCSACGSLFFNFFQGSYFTVSFFPTFDRVS